MTKLVLTVVGIDRPGLVEALSTALNSHEGNWLESEFLHLAGQFAGIALVDVPGEQTARFSDAVAALQDAIGLRVTVTPAEDHTAEGPATGASVPVRLHLLGQDRPGVVRQVTSALATEHVTIQEFSSWTRPAPEGGGTLFEAESIVQLPEGTDASVIREALEPIAAELMVDLEVE